MELKETLTMLRIRQGLSQNELALKINVSKQAIYKWEHGTAVPSTENLIILGRLYGVPLDELVNGGPPVAVAEEPETTPPADGEAPGKRGRNIAARIGLAACLVLVTIAAIITIWSAIFKEPEKPNKGIIRTEDIEPDYIDPSELVPFDGTWKIVE